MRIVRGEPGMRPRHRQWLPLEQNDGGMHWETSFGMRREIWLKSAKSHHKKT